MYQIKLLSYYGEFWRYNIVIIARGIDTDGRQLYYESVDYAIAEDLQQQALSNYPVLPLELQQGSSISLECADAPNLDLYIHIVPLTLPLDKNVIDALPFAVTLEVTHGENLIYEAQHDVNLWGGASLNIKLPEVKVYE